MTHKILTILAVFFFSYSFTTAPKKSDISLSTIPLNETLTAELSVEEEISQLYTIFAENNSTVPSLESFRNGLIGYYKLAEDDLVEKEILTIIDFSLSSTQKRLWVLDMETQEVLMHSVVAHGKNTGGEFATKFSNTVNSLQSSLGFYITGETYMGGNGYSLFIDGMEKEFNSNARKRYVVIHGADYANPEIASRLGRLGRSYGCPAVPTALTNDFINTIKDKSVLYIHSGDEGYAKRSKMIQV